MSTLFALDITVALKMSQMTIYVYYILLVLGCAKGTEHSWQLFSDLGGG